MTDNAKPTKKVLMVPRHGMPERSAAERNKDFNEVTLGYTQEMAVEEAGRCLHCKTPTCIDGCPVKIDIPAFIKEVYNENFTAAAASIAQYTNLPSICGRVCPQEVQCEEKCILGKKKEPVAIGRVERWIGDWAREHGGLPMPAQQPAVGKKVAVIGSGPSGLTLAGEMARRGYDVTIFEALHEPGGVLVYGIPEFRLPKAIVKSEIESLKKLGVKIEVNTLVGQTVTVDELMQEQGFAAVFIGTGAGLPYFMDVPGENYLGVYTANEFLTRVNLMRAWRFPEYDTPVHVGKRVAVFGGGNTAMDSARTAKRLGPEKVYLLYRRTKAEMPARIEEVHHAEEEEIEFHLLSAPVRFLGDEKGRLKGVEMLKMELGEPDASGRRRPVPIKGSEYTLEIDTAVIAIGNGAHPIITRNTPGLETNKHGYIVADPQTGATSRPGVYAGGDIVTGAATVIQAMGAGKRAAEAMDAYLKGQK